MEPQPHRYQELHEFYKQGQILLVDKPLTWTSFDVVNKIRIIIKHELGLKKIKVGHAGTLDPLATGLLVLCMGKFTKRIEEFQGQEKEYTGTIRLGATTPSYDLESEIDQTFPTEHIDSPLLAEAVAKLTGEIEQVPPIFSAVMVDGKRAYKAARKGEKVEIKKRQVTISAFETPRFELPDVDFRIACSKGTYIRSMAHDLGQLVNSGGHLTALRRTRIGDFKVEDAISIEDFRASVIERREAFDASQQ